MVSSAVSAKLTYDDYCQFPDDGKRHEVMDGEHFVSPAPGVRHQVIVGRLHAALERFLALEELGTVLLAPLDVVLSETDVVQPDLVFVASANGAIITEPNLQGAPDLVIEVVSPSTRRRDEELKRKLYERFGVREFWLVDPEARRAVLYRGGGGRFSETKTLLATAGDILASALLPGLAISLPDLFA